MTTRSYAYQFRFSGLMVRKLCLVLPHDRHDAFSNLEYSPYSFLLQTMCLHDDQISSSRHSCAKKSTAREGASLTARSSQVLGVASGESDSEDPVDETSVVSS